MNVDDCRHGFSVCSLMCLNEHETNVEGIEI